MHIIKTILIIMCMGFFLFFGCMGVHKQHASNIIVETPFYEIEKLDTASNNFKAPNEADRQGWITANTVNVRAEPNTDSRILTTITKGQSIILEQLDGGWWKATVQDTLSGFVKASLVSKCRFWEFDLLWGLQFGMKSNGVRSIVERQHLKPQYYLDGECCFIEGYCSLYGHDASIHFIFGNTGKLICIRAYYKVHDSSPDKPILYRDELPALLMSQLGLPAMEGTALHNLKYHKAGDIYCIAFRDGENSLILFKDTYFPTEILAETGFGGYAPTKIIRNWATLEFCAPEIADSVMSASW